MVTMSVVPTTTSKRKKTTTSLWLLSLYNILVLVVVAPPPSLLFVAGLNLNNNNSNNYMMNRNQVLNLMKKSLTAATVGWFTLSSMTTMSPPAAQALISVSPPTTKTTAASPPPPRQQQPGNIINGSGDGGNQQAVVAYKDLSLPLSEFDVTVPVACWFPTTATATTTTVGADSGADVSTQQQSPPCYQHRISVRKIGQLLAGWDLPDWAAREFALTPTLADGAVVADHNDLSSPIFGNQLNQQQRTNRRVPVVLLAHGYLGSRFDLSHLAEKLAREGFVCLAPEFPESLAASYETTGRDGLDRSYIMSQLLTTMKYDWKIKADRYGIVGHSMGCGTAIQTGDDDWTRVLIAGFPRQRDGSPLPGRNLLFLSSMNDGAVSMAGNGDRILASDHLSVLDEKDALSSSFSSSSLPRRAALIYDRPDAPNHISFLAEGVNDAMIKLLSPLLPVAQLLSIPVLDFDRYQKSRDSDATAAAVHPLVIQYLKQQMG